MQAHVDVATPAAAKTVGFLTSPGHESYDAAGRAKDLTIQELL